MVGTVILTPMIDVSHQQFSGKELVHLSMAHLVAADGKD